MREITHEELKQIQLGILDKVHEFCEKNGITYFLSSGTLIGAVRHKGYIPWDDDLDLYMPRPDYNKFIKLFSENSPENTKLLSLETDKKYQYPFAKVIDDRTEMVETSYGEKFKIGVYVDIFPLENVPDKALKFVYWFAVASTLKAAVFLSAYIGNLGFRWVFKEGTFTKKILRIFLFPIFVISPLRFWLLAYDAFVKNVSVGKYVYNMSCGMGIHGCFRRSATCSAIEIEFEGRKYKTMSGYQEYLYVTYGDFMQLPPIEKRIPSHSFTAWWKK